jgi:hypothetical protein
LCFACLRRNSMVVEEKGKEERNKGKIEIIDVTLQTEYGRKRIKYH